MAGIQARRGVMLSLVCLFLLMLLAPGRAVAQDDVRQLAKAAGDPIKAIEILGGTIAVDDQGRPVRVHMAASKAWTEDMVYLEGFTELRELHLPTAVDDDGMAIIKTITSLDSLSLANTRVGDDGLRELTELPHLRRLNLKGSRVTDDGLRHVAEMKSLQHLIVPTGMTDVGMEHVLQVATLEALDVSYSRITAATVTQLDKLSNLTSLDIGRMLQLKDDCVPGLAKLTGLRHLRMAAARFSAEALCELKSLTELESLWAPHCHVDKSALDAWAGLTKLRELNITNTDVTDGAMPSLAPFAELRTLFLTAGHLTDEGVALLPDLPYLEEFTLINLNFTDAALAPLAKYKTLKTLRLHPQGYKNHEHITEAAVQRLRDAIPGLHVE